MSREFKDLRANSAQTTINEAIIGLTPLMSKRLARLLECKTKKRAERNQKLSAKAKENKEAFVDTYNLVVEMREIRIDKLKNIMRKMLEWTMVVKNVRTVSDAVNVLEDALDDKK